MERRAECEAVCEWNLKPWMTQPTIFEMTILMSCQELNKEKLRIFRGQKINTDSWENVGKSCSLKVSLTHFSYISIEETRNYFDVISAKTEGNYVFWREVWTVFTCQGKHRTYDQRLLKQTKENWKIENDLRNKDGSGFLDLLISLYHPKPPFLNIFRDRTAVFFKLFKNWKHCYGGFVHLTEGEAVQPFVLTSLTRHLSPLVVVCRRLFRASSCTMLPQARRFCCNCWYVICEVRADSLVWNPASFQHPNSSASRIPTVLQYHTALLFFYDTFRACNVNSLHQHNGYFIKLLLVYMYARR